MPNASETSRRRGTIQSVDRAARILKALGGGPRRLGVSQLADQLGLSRPTVHGLLQTLAAHGFGVFSTMAALRGATKTEPGVVGGEVVVGDVEVAAGDWVVGDADGVVVIHVNRVDLEDVVAAAEHRAQTEQRLFAALRAGNTTVELLQLDASRITRGS